MPTPSRPPAPRRPPRSTSTCSGAARASARTSACGAIWRTPPAARPGPAAQARLRAEVLATFGPRRRRLRGWATASGAVLASAALAAAVLLRGDAWEPPAAPTIRPAKVVHVDSARPGARERERLLKAVGRAVVCLYLGVVSCSPSREPAPAPRAAPTTDAPAGPSASAARRAGAVLRGGAALSRGRSRVRRGAALAPGARSVGHLRGRSLPGRRRGDAAQRRAAAGRLQPPAHAGRAGGALRRHQGRGRRRRGADRLRRRDGLTRASRRSWPGRPPRRPGSSRATWW